MTNAISLSLLLVAAACSSPPRDAASDESDSSFAALQNRGAEAMGVDQNSSTHVFESLPDGGRIVLQRDSMDIDGAEVIRAHMRDIAARFGAGDFTIPGMVHAQVVPGTAEMTTFRDRIKYLVDTLPRGAQVRIVSTDIDALKAIHAFLAFSEWITTQLDMSTERGA